MQGYHQICCSWHCQLHIHSL
uniref:Uncharacterized protein n=1 Tax=Arundo donax TaxID=35708 RepID=A0A0A9A532_ARUDO